MRFALAAVTLAVLTQQPSPDPFVTTHDDAAARQPASAAFTIAFPGGGHTFRIGEAIPLVLTYDYVANRSFLKGIPLDHFATPVIDYADGTSDPSGDLDRAGIYTGRGICGCIEGGTPGVSPPAVHLDAWLTSSVRFDRPGHYRLYISDHHDNEYHPLAERPAPIVSNVLDLDIVRDRAWEDATLDAAIDVLDTSSNAEARQRAMWTIADIDSPRAVEEMLRRLTSDRGFWSGVYRIRDRDRVIHGVGALIDDPAHPASFDDIRALAILQLTQAKEGQLSAAEKRAAMRAVETRRLEALRRAGTLVDALTTSLREDARKPAAPESIGGPRPGTGPVLVTDALARFVDATEMALARLPRPLREDVLQRDADALVERAFAPMLERLSRAGSGNAVRLLNDVAPERARPIVLADLALARPLWPADVTGLLPDSTLPVLDPVFLRQLQAATTRAEAREALLRINRYATAAIAPAVARAYNAQQWRGSCDVAVPAMSFLFRVDVPRARAIASRSDCAGEWYRSLNWDSTVVRMSPGLETFAGTQAAAGNPDAAIWASRLLAWHGTAGAKALTLQAFAAWRRRADVNVEKELMFALVIGNAWRLTGDDIAAACAGLPADDCEDWLRSGVAGSSELSVGVWISPATRRKFFSLQGRGRLTEAQLLARLSEFPPGTAFRWARDPNTSLHEWDIDVDRDMPVAAGLLARKGMTLVVK